MDPDQVSPNQPGQVTPAVQDAQTSACDPVIYEPSSSLELQQDSMMSTSGVPWEVVALIYTSDEVSLDQAEERNTIIKPSAEDTLVVTSGGAWAAPPVIETPLINLSVDEQQISDQLPIENSCDSPGPLTIDEGVKVEVEQDFSAIEVPLITDPNTTPELVTFRPGVYEGDAIPPVYSDFSIIAATEDYEPQVPVPVEPNISIIREPIAENNLITEPAEVTINTEINTHELTAEVNQDITRAVGNIGEQEQTAMVQPAIVQPESSLISSGRILDARLLVTLQNTRLILVYKGYHFSRYYSQGLKIRWQCVNRRCNAYLYSVENKVTVTHLVHNHLAIINQNSTIQSSIAETDAVYTLEEAIHEMTDPVSSFNDGTNPNANFETITLAYNSNQLNSVDATTQTITSSDNNYGTSNVAVNAGNTLIALDPSLEITVKSTSISQENVRNTVRLSPTTTISSVPDPLAICATSYDRTTPNNGIQSDQAMVSKSSNSMTVPKDVKVQVTITSYPKISEPRVYCDGKLVKSKKRKTRSTPAISGTAPVASNAPNTSITGTVTTAYDALTSTQSQTPFSSDLQYSHLFNTFMSRAPPAANPPLPGETLEVARSGASMPAISEPTISTIRLRGRRSPIATASDQRAPMFSYGTPYSFPYSIQRFPATRSIPRISMSQVSADLVPTRRSTRTTRGRNTQYSPQN